MVDRWAWEPAKEQVAAGPPCHAKCDRPEGCDGHEAFSEGDCDEILLRDADRDRNQALVTDRRAVPARARARGRCLRRLRVARGPSGSSCFQLKGRQRYSCFWARAEAA